jgi:hypothetical protein
MIVRTTTTTGTAARRGAVLLTCAAAAAAVLAGAPAPAAASDEGSPSRPVVFDDGRWFVRTGDTTAQTFRYGVDGDYPLMGDWDGDGDETAGVVRLRGDGVLVWYLRNSNSAGPNDVPTFVYGRWTSTSEAYPVAGDWDGDGVDTPGVAGWRQGSGALTWALRNSATAGSPDTTVAFGQATDFPLVGDYDGDGDDTPGVHRQENTFFLSSDARAGAPATRIAYGSTDARIGEHPVVGDWDGNGTDTIGLLRNRPATEAVGGYEQYLLRNSNTEGPATVSFLFGGDRYATVPGYRERLTSR